MLKHIFGLRLWRRQRIARRGQSTGTPTQGFSHHLNLMAGLAAITATAVISVVAFMRVTPVNATAGINEQINYQGRLLTSTGAVVPDGSYNMEFKIVKGGDGCNPTTGTFPCSGTVQWTETRDSSNKVLVKNGYFSVYLGSVTPFGTSVDWNDDTLWLAINIGGTGSPSYDGAMKPLTRFSSTPYALNSKQLGGISAGGFVQLAPGGAQSDGSTNSSIFINKTTTGNLIQLQLSTVDLFTISNAGDQTFGQNANHTISVTTTSTNAGGKNLTVSAGSAGAGATGFGGGTLSLLGGDAAGTSGNANGGDISLQGGAPVNSGIYGNILLAPTSGKVVIGSGGITSGRLNVNGSESTANGGGAGVTITNTASGGGSYYLRIGATGTNTPAGGFSIADNGGYRFILNGNQVGFGGTWTNGVAFDSSNSINAASGTGTGTRLGQTVTATANNDVLTGLNVNPSFINGSFTGVKNYSAVFQGGNVGIGDTTPAALLTVGSGDPFQVDGSGNISSSGTLTLTGAANQISLSNATSNYILYNGNGIAAPTTTSRSAGTKLVLYPSLTGTTTDYAIGIQSGAIWNSVGGTSGSFKWYGGTNVVSTLTGFGELDVSTGFRIGNAAASGNYLRGNGTNFVSSAIQAADLPDLGSSYIKNQTSLQSSSNFRISGTGIADTALLVGYTSVTGGVAAFNGNVGIGTAGPSQLLEVAGTANTGRIRATGVSSAGTEVPGFALYQDSTFKGGLFYNESTATTQLYASNGGVSAIDINGSLNVGIGDTSPAALLTVGNGDLFQVNSSGAIAAATGITTTGGATVNLDGTGDFVIQDNGSTFFTLDDTGGLNFSLDATDNPAFLVTDNGSSNVTFNLAGTGDFVVQDNGTAAFSVLDNGTVRVGDSTNGIDFTSTAAPAYRGTARPTKRVSLIPEFPGALFTPDGSNNNGSMSSDFCSGSSYKNIPSSGNPCAASEEHNYYSWTTTQGTAQDYDIYIRYKIPSDYSRTGTTSTITAINLYGWRSTSGDSVQYSLYNATNGQCGTTTTVTSSDATWQETALASISGDADCDAITADSLVTFVIHVTATNTNYARVGELRFDYKAGF